MIVQCRPSTYRKVVVVWLGNVESYGITKKVKFKTQKSIEFSTFADANGFASKLEKKGINVLEIKFV